MTNRVNERIRRNILVLAVAIGGFWVLSLVFGTKLVPSPFEIFENIVYNVSKILFVHTMYSVLRLLKALGYSVLLALPLGIAMGYMPKVNTYLSPVFYFSYPIPKLALLPLVMLGFGLGETTKIIMMIIIILFPMTVQIRDSIKQMESSVFEPYVALGMTPFHRISLITLKGVLPSLLSSLRIGIGTALSVLFFSENFGTNYGIGYYIMDAWMRMDYLDMYSGIIVISLVGVVLFSWIDWMERKYCCWQLDQGT